MSLNGIKSQRQFQENEVIPVPAEKPFESSKRVESRKNKSTDKLDEKVNYYQLQVYNFSIILGKDGCSSTTSTCCRETWHHQLSCVANDQSKLYDAKALKEKLSFLVDC